MCLAVPSLIISIDDYRMAKVSVMGIERTCSLRLVPDAGVGDYVLVHAGFAIQRIEEQDARETLRLLSEIPELTADEMSEPDKAACAEAPEPDEAADKEAIHESGTI